MKRLARGVLWLLGLAVVMVVAALLYLSVGRGRTPAIVGADGKPLPGSIATLETVRIGGVEQWLLIRGADTRKPVLLFLHGGPGMPAMYLAHEFQRLLERHFIVVQWDRRGAGKSYAAREPADRLTADQLVADILEMTAYLRSRFRRQRIGIVAHSWGTYLGLRAVYERPAWYEYYVGTGQMAGDKDAIHAERRRLVLEGAQARGLTELADRIRNGAAPTEDDLFATGGQLQSASSFLPLLMIGLHAPEYRLGDVLNVRKGAQLWMRRVRDDRPLEWLQQHRAYRVPIYFFLGRHDSNTPSTLAQAYLDSIEAPARSAVWFEQSAHFPFLEESERFASELAVVAEDAARSMQATERAPGR